jgi:hypothetical protein
VDSNCRCSLVYLSFSLTTWEPDKETPPRSSAPVLSRDTVPVLHTNVVYMRRGVPRRRSGVPEFERRALSMDGKARARYMSTAHTLAAAENSPVS